MKHSELTGQIIAICMEVHSTLGPGLLESIYEKAICLELHWAGIKFNRQQEINVNYKGYDLGLGFRADLIIEDCVLVELKSTLGVTPVFKKIVISYLKLTGIEVGLLINFNEVKLTDGISRLVMDKK
ncbi:MAG: GxxExxY protein [Saprospiraceae bacterium]